MIGGNPDIYDSVARVLLPCGYTVRYYSGNREKLYDAVTREKANMGFYAEGGKIETVALGRRISQEQITTALAMAAAEEKRAAKVIMPSHIPGEYLRLISDKGAEVSLASSKRGRWARAALESGEYLPELFEPEARIIRLAEMMLSGKLEKYLDQLPGIQQAEKSVKCSWKDVGRMLRTLVDAEGLEDIELVDGVKVKVDKGWILVKPNAAITACRVIAGSMDAEYSKELTDIYSEKLRSIAEENKE